MAFSDGKITNPKYIDAGDVIVTQFTVEGTNDGPLGSLPPSGRRISLPFCEVCQLDKQGRVVSGGLLLRSIHTLDSARPHPTACRDRLGSHQNLDRTWQRVELCSILSRQRANAICRALPFGGHPGLGICASYAPHGTDHRTQWSDASTMRITHRYFDFAGNSLFDWD